MYFEKYVEFQMGVAEYANNGYAVWKYAGKRTLPFETNAQREEFDDQRYRKDSAYMKLKAVMDYWCSLFFGNTRTLSIFLQDRSIGMILSVSWMWT